MVIRPINQVSPASSPRFFLIRRVINNKSSQHHFNKGLGGFNRHCGGYSFPVMAALKMLLNYPVCFGENLYRETNFPDQANRFDPRSVCRVV